MGERSLSCSSLYDLWNPIRSFRGPAGQRCPICEDERQYIGLGGQQWTRLDDLQRDHHNIIRELEPGLTGIGTHPGVRHRSAGAARPNPRRQLPVGLHQPARPAYPGRGAIAGRDRGYRDLAPPLLLVYGRMGAGRLTPPSTCTPTTAPG